MFLKTLFKKRRKMAKNTYKLFDLAANQLETAIMLFCSGGDRFSVITLAGAADVIFCQLVTRAGKDNFTKIISEKENDPRSIQEVGKDINDTLHINSLKHLDPGEDEYTTLDADECAFGAILKAIANYNMLEGKNENLINGFLAWAQINMDLKKYNIPDMKDNPTQQQGMIYKLKTTLMGVFLGVYYKTKLIIKQIFNKLRG